jgi:hypothetical protein
MGEHKYTREVRGHVVQQYDENGNCIGQSFIFDGPAIWSEKYGNPVVVPCGMKDFNIIELVQPTIVSPRNVGKLGTIHYTNRTSGESHSPNSFDIDIDYSVFEENNNGVFVCFHIVNGYGGTPSVHDHAITVEQWRDVSALVIPGKKISAIKLLREFGGMGLLESKVIVDNFDAYSGVVNEQIERPHPLHIVVPTVVPTNRCVKCEFRIEDKNDHDHKVVGCKQTRFYKGPDKCPLVEMRNGFQGQ